MEFLFEHVSLHLFADRQQTEELLQDMVAQQRPELMIVRDFENPAQFHGVVLEQFYSEQMEHLYGVDRVRKEPPCVVMDICGPALPGFCNRLARRMNPVRPVQPQAPDRDLSWFLDVEKRERPEPVHPVKAFLRNNPPVKIEQELNEHIMGQEAMTAAVADFLYYHALRFLHPELPPRPLLITGPSGCGKTEVWRKVSELYGHIFPVKIVDGSSITCDGWAGNFKVSSFLDSKLIEGGILVVDEFDKLVKPKHSARGENVSYDVQSELLKLMEGEYRLTENKKETDKTTRRMGFVMAGAFDELTQRKAAKLNHKSIGFGTQTLAVPPQEKDLDEADFIAYGVMPEIMGRIAARCEAKQLTDAHYLAIIKGKHSRVAQLSRVLEQYGVKVSGMVSDEEILELVAQSKACRTGVRWVTSQVENRILERIRERGLFSPTAAA